MTYEVSHKYSDSVLILDADSEEELLESLKSLLNNPTEWRYECLDCEE